MANLLLKSLSEGGSDPIYTQAYFLSYKLKALSCMLERSFMEQDVTPSDSHEIKEGIGLLLKDMALEAFWIARSLEDEG